MADRLVDALDRLVRAGVGITTRALADEPAAVDLTLRQWRALVVVAEQDGGGVRVGDLGRRLGMAPPGASRLVRRLETRGLVIVARDTADRRAALVRPTDAGSAVAAAVDDRRRALIAAALRDVDAPPADAITGEIARVAEALARDA